MTIRCINMNSPHKMPLDVYKILGVVFHMPPESIHDSDSSETISAWDSFQTLIMFQEIEKAAGVSFDLKDMAHVRTVADIKLLLKKYNRYVD